MVPLSTLTPESASRALSPFLHSRAFTDPLIRYPTSPTCVSRCKQLSLAVAGVCGYCYSGSRGYGVFPSSQSQDLKKTFLKTPHPSHMLQLTPESVIRPWPWRSSAVICADGAGTSTSHASSLSQDAFCRGTVACSVKTAWESALKTRGCAAEKQKQRAANWGEERA